jgi:hypothetical protein
MLRSEDCDGRSEEVDCRMVRVLYLREHRTWIDVGASAMMAGTFGLPNELL